MKRFHLSSLWGMSLLISSLLLTACGSKVEKIATPTKPTREQVQQARADSIRAAAEAARLAREKAEAEQHQRAAAEAARIAREKEGAARRAAEETARLAAAEAARLAAELRAADEALKPIYFAFDRATLRDDQKPTLNAIAKALKEFQPDSRIIITGHGDERGTEQHNLDLGQRRALAVKQYLVSAGIDPKRIEVVTAGKKLPADPTHSESAWAKNRRVELKREIMLTRGE